MISSLKAELLGSEQSLTAVKEQLNKSDLGFRIRDLLTEIEELKAALAKKDAALSALTSHEYL